MLVSLALYKFLEICLFNYNVRQNDKSLEAHQNSFEALKWTEAHRLRNTALGYSNEYLKFVNSSHVNSFMKTKMKQL